jgi:hypothetical protein
MLPIAHKKPNLPPRPGVQLSGSGSLPAPRLSNPFASFFGSRTAASITSSSNLSSTSAETDKAIDISAIVIDRKILMNTVSRQIYKEMMREVQDALKEAGVPFWVVERVSSFMTPYLPVMKSKRNGTYSLQDDTSCSKPAAELSDAFQNFYEDLEQEIRSSKRSPRKQEDVTTSQNSVESEKGMGMNEEKIHEIVESVEKVVCTVLSDRLLRPETSDDARHDEALASRIAALNLLELTPEHLGVDVGPNGRALAGLISKCGKGLYLIDIVSMDKITEVRSIE